MMLGHAIRDEMDDLFRVITDAGEKVYEAAATLCIQASAYITIDVSKRLPTEADYREVARIGSEAKTELPVTEDEMYAYAYLSQVIFGFESPLTVFEDSQKAAMIPLFTTANLLLSFFPKGQHWTDYLDTIWNSIEDSEQASLAILPALLYRHHALTAQAGKSVRPSTYQQ